MNWNWKTYDKDRDATILAAGSYLCRLEYPDGRVRYRVKQFTVFGNSVKRGYFATNGKKYTITHYCSIQEPIQEPIQNERESNSEVRQ